MEKFFLIYRQILCWVIICFIAYLDLLFAIINIHDIEDWEFNIIAVVIAKAAGIHGLIALKMCTLSFAAAISIYKNYLTYIVLVLHLLLLGYYILL